jgi:hypothetical protein
MITLCLVPAFSAFELAAMIASVFAAPTLREGHGGGDTKAQRRTSDTKYVLKCIQLTQSGPKRCTP